jgi:hypothetical protein
MTATERDKGARGELEIVRLLQNHSWPDAKRTSDGRHQQHRGDIANGPPNVHLEIRRRETLNIWACLKQAAADAAHGHRPVVAFRRSRSQWYAAVELDFLLDLLADADK